VKSRNDIFNADIGVSLSVTTEDIRKGVYSKPEIDEIFGSDIPFKPEKFKRLIIINSTTQPLSWSNRTPLSFYANAKLNVLKQHFYLRLNRIGSSYYSYGNPYLVNDIRKLSLEDRIDFFKKKLRLTLLYSHFENNLADMELSTKLTQVGSARVNLNISRKYPTLMASYSYYARDEKLVTDQSVLQQLSISNLMLGGSYGFSTASFKHQLSAYYNRYMRQFELPAYATHVSNSLNFSLTENFPYNLLLQVYYQSFVQTLDTADLSLQYMYGFTAGWSSNSGKLRITASSMNIRVIQSNLGNTEFLRQQHKISLTILPVQRFSINLEAGYGAFNENMTALNYDEYWGLLRLTYLIR